MMMKMTAMSLMMRLILTAWQGCIEIFKNSPWMHQRASTLVRFGKNLHLVPAHEHPPNAPREDWCEADFSVLVPLAFICLLHQKLKIQREELEDLVGKDTRGCREGSETGGGLPWWEPLFYQAWRWEVRRRARKVSSQVSREIGECGKRCALESLRPGEGERVHGAWKKMWTTFTESRERRAHPGLCGSNAK